MGEYEPRDSRTVTHSRHQAPGEPPRTGPREGETRRPRQQGQTELDQDERGEDAEETIEHADAEAEAELRERAMERDAEELGDRND